MMKRHIVQLSDDQRSDLERRFCGRLTLRERNRVQVLLRSDRGDTDDEIADALEVCVVTVAHIRRRFAADGLEAALGERPRSGGPRTVLDEKRLKEVTHQSPRNFGRKRSTWTLQLLAAACPELGSRRGALARQPSAGR
jgi:transposase